MDDDIDPTDFEHASEEQLTKALEVAVDALGQYVIENADLDTALVAISCRNVLDGNPGDHPAGGR